MTDAPAPDFRIVGALPAPAFSALIRGLCEVYPDARFVDTGGVQGFAVALGEMVDPVPEWMS